MTPEQRGYAKATVIAILFCREKITMELIGSILPDFQRNKSSVSRMYSHAHFFTQDIAWQSVMIVCKLAHKQIPIGQRGTRRPWILIFDSTHRTRFGKLLDNLISTHGENSKKRFYAFVWPLLISPSGVRITLPPMMWLSRSYAKQHHRKHQTQPRLAATTLRYLAAKLKKANLDFNLVILADSAFDCKELWQICQKHNQTSLYFWTIITSSSRERCLGSNGPKASRLAGQKVLNVMYNQPLVRKKKLDPFQLTGIPLRSRQKFSHNKRQKTSSSTVYSYAQKQLRVADIGDANVVLSYKLKDRSQHESQAPWRILLCNNHFMSAEEIICYYSMRWEIETFFREQKSNFAFKHFQAHNHKACSRFVDLLCLSFNFLEFDRIQLLEHPDPTLLDSQQELNWLRTKGLTEIFKRQAAADSIKWLFERLQTPFGIRRLRKALLKLKMPLKIFELLHQLKP